jgi:hypothetical protein
MLAVTFSGFPGLLVIQVLQPFEEDQVGDLFDSGEGVGDAAGPKSIPQASDVGLQLV